MRRRTRRGGVGIRITQGGTQVREGRTQQEAAVGLEVGARGMIDGGRQVRRNGTANSR
jgi:hypothetical protein